MKRISIATLFIILFVSCHHDEGDDFNSNTIHLSKYEVKLWYEQEEVIEIINPTLDMPEVESDNPQIATGAIEDNKLKISSKGIGKTILHIKDRLNNRADIKITSSTFNGEWIENILPERNMIYKVEVVALNEQIAAKLEQEILESAQNKYHSRFTFDYGGVPLRAAIFDNKNSTSEVYKGKYIYNNDMKHLILEYNNLIESYSVDPISYYIAKLTQDLTDLYQKLYPDYEVKKVILTKYLMRAVML